ncbi:MAG: DUF4825 domain-containing protein [Clostridia bacterium]|nr:DUF4825 domain-containing protein [Clostridia bacterium]
MESMFLLVLSTSLYASVVGAVIIILKAILKNRISPKWHYIVWIILMLKLLIPFGPESAVSLFNTIPEIPQQTSFTKMYEEYRQSSISIRQENSYTLPSFTTRDSLLFLAAKAETATPYIWLAGAMLMLCWLLFTNHSLNKRIKASMIPVPESITHILEECKEKMGVKKDLRIVIQNIIRTPSLLGVFSPKILITPAILDLSHREISYVLLHELAHYKRKDLIANHLLLLLQLIHWFNPVIWYCFKRIRLDMEVAADEQVLTLLKSTEQKEYGKALLSVVETFSYTRLAPRLIGMIDDKKNIEKRIKMIKMTSFFKSRRRTVLVIGILCITILSGVLLTSSLTKDDSALDQKENTVLSDEYNAATLLKFKTAYVGDNSKVVNLLNSLPLANMRREVSLKTGSRPYGISVQYDLNTSSLDTGLIESTFRKNATAMFALIDNVDEINFISSFSGKEKSYRYNREHLQKSYNKDLREYAKDTNALKTLLYGFSMNFAAYPEKYALTMSSTPGIRILAQFRGTADMVEYSATSGRLMTWDSTSGKITEYGQNAKLPLSAPIYWGPSADETDKAQDGIIVKAAIYYKNVKLTQKQLTIKLDTPTYSYTVVPSDDVIIADTTPNEPQNPKTVEEAVSIAIKAKGEGYVSGETSTEGHIIFDMEEKNGKTKVYTIASYGAFGFENGIFTKVSGSGAIATVLTFSRNEKGEYTLLEYKEPMDGSYNLKSKKDMFPRKLWDSVISEHKYYPDLAKQQEEQAKKYLQSINRKATVSEAYTEKTLPKIDVEASNKIFTEYTKFDAELNKFPYWLGTKESVENGMRYIYETSQSKTSDGYDLISFKKTREDGAVVKEYQYKIIGNKIYPLNQK